MKANRKLFAALAALAILISACGGGGEATTTTDGATPSTSEDPGPDTTTTEATPASSPDGTGESLATVTVDGTEYEFGMNFAAATCNPDFFGGFFAVLYTEEVSGVFSVELWNEGAGDGAQTTRAELNITVDGVEMDLEADPEGVWPAVEEGTSFVESFSYEGNSAQGTISFIDTEVAYNADLFPLDPVIATFEVTCGDE